MVSVNLPDKLVKEAKRCAAVHTRSVPKQIEHWIKIARFVEDNPDVPPAFVQEIMAALNDPEPATPFRFTEVEPPSWYDNPEE